METVDVGERYLKSEIVTRSRSVIENDINNIETQLGKFYNKGTKLYDNLSDDAKSKIDDVFSSVIENDELSLLDKDKKIKEISVTCDDQPNLIETINLGFEIYKKEKEVVSLTEEIKPFVVEDVKALANDISNRINFDKIVNYFLEKRDSSSSDDFISIDNILSLGKIIVDGNNGILEQNDLNYLYEREEFLEKLKRKCNNHSFLGFKNKEISDDKNIEEVVDKKSLLEKVDRVNEKLFETYTLYMVYRSTSSFKKNMSGFLEILDRQHFFNDEIEDSHYDQRFLKAIEKRFREDEKKLRESGLLSQNGEERQHLIESKREKARIRRMVKITGLEANDGKKLVIIEDEIKSFLRNTFPAVFLKISEIEMLKEKPKNDIDFESSVSNINRETKVVTVGKYLPILDKQGNLMYGYITIYEPFEVDENDNKEAELIVKKGFMDTLAHEIGHGVHYDLGVDDLKKWEKIMKDDGTEITWYVGYAGKKSELIKKREDFCESFMLFVRDPKLLSILSPSRFQYMRELFVDYIEDYNKKIFEENLNLALKLSEIFMKKNGYTEEYLKDIYIPKKQ